MDLPVAWLPCQHKLPPTSSPNQDVSHPGILSIFTLSTDSPYPVWVVSNWRSQKHKKNQSINLAWSPPSQDTSGKVKLVEIQDSLPKHDNLARVVTRREGATPNSIYFTKQCGLGSSSHKKAAFPVSSRICKRSDAVFPARPVDSEESHTAVSSPWGRSGLSFWNSFSKSKELIFVSDWVGKSWTSKLYID